MYDGHAQSVTDMACCCDGCQRNGETESQNKEKKNQPRGHNALMDKVNPLGQSLRWRSQFTPQPARCFPRFHRINKLDHALMNVIASWAFEGSDVKAGRAKRDPCQHRFRFALRTWWSVKCAHDAVPYIRREHKALSLQMPFPAVMGIVFHPRASTCVQYRPPLGNYFDRQNVGYNSGSRYNSSSRI